jgi:DNA invertase Pin-like site-specific DNA recombinase
MNAALYMRVSTDDQTVEPQRTELRTFCQQKKWTITNEFEDVISGAKAEREGLAQLMEGVRSKKYDVVCIVRIDRLARSLSHFAQLVEEFHRHGVALVVTAQGIDTSKSNACGQLQMNVLISVAVFERTLIQERTKAGLVVARRNGKILGRPSNKLPDELEQTRIIQAWREAGGKDYRLLARQLGGVNASTAWRLYKKFEARLPVVMVVE